MLRRFYKASIICFYVMITLLVVANLMYAVVGYEQMGRLMMLFDNLPLLVRLPLGFLGAFSAFGILMLWLGMIWDCVFMSQLPAWSKAKWLAILLVINWLGGLIYYYRVFKDRSLNSVQASA